MEWATSFKVTGVKDDSVFFLHPASRAAAVNTRRTGARNFLIIPKDLSLRSFYMFSV